MNMIEKIDMANARVFPALLEEAEYPDLTPGQQLAFEQLERMAAVSPTVYLEGSAAVGKSTVVRAFARKYGGKIIGSKELDDATLFHDTRLEDSAVVEYIQSLMTMHDLVIIDDMRDIAQAGHAVRGDPNQGIAGAHFKHLVNFAIRHGKRLIMITWPGASTASGYASASVRDLTAEDYALIVSNLLGVDRVRGVDFHLIYRFASMLNGHELRMAAQLVAHMERPTTEAFVEALDQHVLASNIRVQEIEALIFDALPGAEHITSKLETHVILPLENRELAHSLGLRPKRGVLLYGPPGTGKTSIGRALAHRMQGKFFLIDGSIITEPPGPFFQKLAATIQEAKQSSPSVLFIDDADVLFDIVHISGLARYLLTLLDGLESESASHVCVMMTAMDVRKVPEALLRSGRVELWLETRPPQGGDRGRVLQRWLGKDLPQQEDIDYQAFSDATEGFTPADLRRIAGDATCLYAADLAKDKPPATADLYLQRAVSGLVAVRDRMACVMQDDSVRVGNSRKPRYGLGLGGMAEMGVSCKTKGWD